MIGTQESNEVARLKRRVRELEAANADLEDRLKYSMRITIDYDENHTAFRDELERVAAERTSSEIERDDAWPLMRCVFDYIDRALNRLVFERDNAVTDANFYRGEMELMEKEIETMRLYFDAKWDERWRN